MCGFHGSKAAAFIAEGQGRIALSLTRGEGPGCFSLSLCELDLGSDVWSLCCCVEAAACPRCLYSRRDAECTGLTQNSVFNCVNLKLKSRNKIIVSMGLAELGGVCTAFFVCCFRAKRKIGSR